MGWFGGGSDEPSSSGGGSEGYHMDSPDMSLDASLSGGGASAGDFQQFSMAIQQQMVVQQAITDLCDKAFGKCVTQCKDAHLSGKEVACIHAVTNKWLDANEYMVGRLARKQQQASGQQGFN
jgi:hypothetical protein